MTAEWCSKPPCSMCLIIATTAIHSELAVYKELGKGVDLQFVLLMMFLKMNASLVQIHDSIE